MRIAEITAYRTRIPLRRTVRHASYTRGENDTLIVRCRLDDGTEGWGEGLPRPYVTGETIQTALELLQHSEPSRWLSGRIGSLADAVHRCRQFELPAPALPDCAGVDADNGHRDCFGNTVRCAVELSILDAFARAEGVPLSAVTGLLSETAGIRRSSDHVRYSGILTCSGPVREWVDSWKLRLYGFAQCKAKVGAGGDDAARLARLRRIVGSGVDLRVDANEAWTCDLLESKLAPLVPYGITAVEQPVPRRQTDCLAAMRRKAGVPIMLDESLCSLADAQRAIERGTCDLFNIRLSKCGGYLNSLQIAATAHRAGLGYQLGCQVGETGILSAAGRHFATSVGDIRYLEGSYDRHLVRQRLTVEDVTFGRGGRAPALEGPGLGVMVDTEALGRVTVREERWTIG